MLSQIHRFHGHGGLRYVYRHGKTARTRCFLLRFVRETNYPHGRVTVIVSKKTLKSAAKRNRVRRRVYEVIRQEWDRLELPCDLAITVYAAEVALMPARALSRELRRLLTDARLYKKPEIHATVEKTEGP